MFFKTIFFKKDYLMILNLFILVKRNVLVL